MSKPKYLWMCVTADEFELPCTPVFDSAQQLANHLGVTKTTVETSIFYNRSGKNNGMKPIRVDISNYHEHIL